MKKRNRRLLLDLGHRKLKRALYHAIDMRSALRVITVWSEYGELVPEHVRTLCMRALRGNGK